MSQLPEDPMSQAEIDEIKAMYREAADGQPSAAHDAAVLAAMQAELAAARRAKARPLRKWQLPVALAATVVLTFALTLTVEREQPNEVYAPALQAPMRVAPGSPPPAGTAPAVSQPQAKALPGTENARGLPQNKIGGGKPAVPEVPAQELQDRAFAPPAATVPVPPAAPSSASEAASPALGKEQSVPVPAPQRAPDVSDPRTRSQFFEPGIRSDGVNTPQHASGANSVPAPSAPSQPAPPVVPRNAADAAKTKLPAQYEAKPEAPPRAAPPPPPPPAPKPEPARPSVAPAPPVVSEPEVAAPQAFPRAVESRQRDNLAAPVRQPHEWLEVIRGLKQAGKNEEAEAELKKFRLAYPDYPVPADLAPPAKP